MRETNVLGEYQESGMGAESEEALIDERMREQRKQVLEVLGMPGYSILHGMFVEAIEGATKRLQNLNLSEAQLRYEQGVVAGISRVQSAFVRFNEEVDKEDSDVDE